MPIRDEMANKDDARRVRDVFPRTYALWLLIRGGSRRSAKYVSSSVAMPSAWTTAVLAGGLALFLSILLLLVDPPPEASLSSTQAHRLVSPGAGAPPLEVAILHGQFPAGWEERLEELWVSQPVREAVQPTSLLAFDQWQAARAQPLPFDAPASHDFEPYYLKAEFVDFDQLTAAVSADEAPLSGSNPVVLRGLALDIERGPAVPATNGALAYTLHVRNTGSDAVDHIRVVETLPQVERVTDVVPPAAISPDGALVWELSAVAPQEERVLTITLMPDSETAALNTVAALDIESQFAVATLVRPAGNLELFSPEPEPADLALPEMTPDEPMPAFIDEPIVSAPVDEPVVPPDESAAERAAAESVDPFGSSQEAAPEDAVIPSWILEDDDGPPAPRSERPSTTLPPAADPVMVDPAPAEPQTHLPSQPPEEEEGWSPTPRPAPLDAVQPQPLLDLRTRSQTTAAAGEIVTTVFEISNRGDAPAEEVLLTVHLGPGLKHKHGDTIEHHIATLAPGETRTARLYTRATAAGPARFDAILSHAGESDDEQSHAVRIAAPGSRFAP